MQPFDPATFDSWHARVYFDAASRDAVQPNAAGQVELKLRPRGAMRPRTW